MAKFSGFRRIIKEDFDKEDQALIDKLAFPINQMLESLISAMGKGLTFEDNIQSQIKTVRVTVDGSGTPKSAVSFTSELPVKIKGIQCLRAINVTNSTVYPTSAPFLSFSENSGNISITNITGLQADNVYNLTLLIL